MHTLTLTLNAKSAAELECQLRALRVAVMHRRDDLLDRKRGRSDNAQSSYQWRIDFLESVLEQMYAQEAEWLARAKHVAKWPDPK